MNNLFKVPTRADKTADSLLAKRVNAQPIKSATTIRSGSGLVDRINAIRSMVEKSLGNLHDDYIIIQDEDVLKNYIDSCISNGVISIDTETTGLDPLRDTLVGICIYTPNEKAAYIPVHHKSYITNLEVENQLSVDVLHDQFSRIEQSQTKVIMFNACFDIRFLRSGINVYLTCYWDCYLGARCLNENEGSGNNGLKKLHNKYVLNGEGDAFKFDDLFSGVSFDLVPITVGYLYAAHDAIITYELYQFQLPFLTADNEKCKSHMLEDVAWVFRHIEMECLPVVADLEDTGITFDINCAEILHEKYHILQQEKKDVVYTELNEFSSKINEYRLKTSTCKLSDPINVDSPVQVAIILYDIMGIESVDAKSPRGTGEEVLAKINIPFTKALLEYRAVQKLIGTYIDKLPDCVNPKDGRIHCKFNQYGADTGRFSSQDPNLQNIPSHNKDIRKMFRASDGYVLMSSDYSQQEPKMMAQLCNDPKMIQAYRDGKDLYAEIASLAFKQPYEECLEFRLDGTTNKEGKSRRTQAKSILLGVLYGRGVVSIAEQLGTTPSEAQSIKDAVFKGFPAIKKFEEDSIRMAEDYGFVTTLWGRKRRLPAMLLPDYEVKWKDGVAPDNDPLSFDNEVNTEVPENICRKWIQKVRSVPFRDKRKVFEAANEEGLWIVDHTKDKDVTKVVNARIQGSAADMSKLAMIKVGKDARLKELGFRLLIPVHDELIGECPKENAKECSERFAMLMNTAAEKLTIPISCDVEITEQWYGERVEI